MSFLAPLIGMASKALPWIATKVVPLISKAVPAIGKFLSGIGGSAGSGGAGQLIRSVAGSAGPLIEKISSALGSGDVGGLLGSPEVSKFAEDVGSGLGGLFNKPTPQSVNAMSQFSQNQRIQNLGYGVGPSEAPAVDTSRIPIEMQQAAQEPAQIQEQAAGALPSGVQRDTSYAAPRQMTRLQLQAVLGGHRVMGSAVGKVPGAVASSGVARSATGPVLISAYMFPLSELYVAAVQRFLMRGGRLTPDRAETIRNILASSRGMMVEA